MSFGDAIKSVLQVNYANFNGRARRSEFWYWVLFAFIVGIVINIIERIAPTLGVIIDIVWALGTIVPFLALSSRRFHDTGKSGWFTLLWFPGIVLLFIPAIVAIVFWCQDSQADNQYGPSPKGIGGGYPQQPDPAYPSYPPAQ